MEQSLASKVENTIRACLFKTEECLGKGVPPEGAVMVDGITARFGFHPDRLIAHREEIRGFLNEMHPTFHKESGGGWSFLNLCMDKHGNQWAEHKTIEALIVLGMAVGMVEYCMPRDKWNIMPGCVPYIVFNTQMM